MNNIINRFKEKPIYEYILVSFLFIIVCIIFAQYSELLISGYHFTDDHEIIEISRMISTKGFLATLTYFVKDDLIWRFRPLYIIVRVFRTLIFSTNFFLWHLWLAIECGLYITLSYILAREMKTPLIASLIFSFIFLIGSQDEIIWRLGPQESMGMVFLPLSLLFTLFYYKKNKKIYGILTVIVTIFAMMTKESFLILSPLVLLFLFYLFLKDSNDNNFINNFLCFVKKYKILILFICMFSIIFLLIILLCVGLLESGYAGIDTSYTLGEYIRITLNVFIRDLKDYWLILGLLFVLFIINIFSKIREKKFKGIYLQTLIIVFIAICYSLGIEAILYAKSAMFDRYKLPFLWILYFALIVLLNKSIKDKYINLLTIIICVFTIFVYNQQEHDIFQDAKYYAKDGINTTEMLHYVGSKKTNNGNLIVLTDFSWYEHNLSSSMYLQLEENIKDVFYHDNEKEDGDYKKIYNVNDLRISVNNADIILVDSGTIENYDSDKYIISVFSNYYVLEKK